MDAALHQLPVTFVTGRAEVTRPDGGGHQGMCGGSILPLVPGIRVAAPRDPGSPRERLREALETRRPTGVRYPKGMAGPDVPAVRRVGPWDNLRGQVGSEVLVGPRAAGCPEAAEELSTRLPPYGSAVRAVSSSANWRFTSFPPVEKARILSHASCTQAT